MVGGLETQMKQEITENVEQGQIIGDNKCQQFPDLQKKYV